MDLAGDHAVHEHPAGGLTLPQNGPGHGEGGLIHDAAADEQNLGQNEQHQQHGEDGAPSQALADAGDGGLRGHLADQQAGHHQNGAGGQHRGEGKVQRLDHGLFPAHGVLDLLVPAGDHDGVVDVGTHLDRAGHQVQLSYRATWWKLTGSNR